MTSEATGRPDESGTGPSNLTVVLLVVAWAWVGIPLLYGLYELVRKAVPPFTK